MNFNFNTQNGVPITLDRSIEPSFYIYPNDLNFIEKATNLYKSVKEQSEELSKKHANVKLKVDNDGVPENVEEVTNIIKEEFQVILDSIDELLGEDVSEKVFKGRVNFALLGQFMDFLSEVISKTRETSMDSYIKPRNRAERRAMNKVMD